MKALVFELLIELLTFEVFELVYVTINIFNHLLYHYH